MVHEIATGEERPGKIAGRGGKIASLGGPKNVTNHSVRKTSISRLLDANHPDVYVTHLSRHKCLQSLISYKTAVKATISAAFDTVDHNILLDSLKLKVGVSGKVLDWFSSYLLNRTQRVSINGTLSDSFELKWGVPQGSCLGPLLFVIYASKLFDITHVHLPNVHCYADDSQIYLSFKPDSAANQESAIAAIENCIKDIRNIVRELRNKKEMGNTDL